MQIDDSKLFIVRGSIMRFQPERFQFERFHCDKIDCLPGFWFLLFSYFMPYRMTTRVRHRAIKVHYYIFINSFGKLNFDFHCLLGDRQPWATPRPPALRIVNKSEFLDGKPYGTFAAQTNLDSYQMETKKTKTDFDIADNNETSDDGISRTFNPDLLPDDDLARPADLKRRKSDVRDDT